MHDTTPSPTIQQLIDLPELTEAKLSPDGRQVAYVVRLPDWSRNAYDNQIWLADARAQGSGREVGTGDRIAWSPDSQSLACIARRNDDAHAQVYRLNLADGKTERLTSLNINVESVRWSPDGEHLSLIVCDPPTDALLQRRQTYGDLHVQDEDDPRNQLWLLRLADGVCRPLTDHAFGHVVHVDWRPDGQQLAVEAWPSAHQRYRYQGEIRAIDPCTGQARTLTEPGYGTPCYAPDGQALAAVRHGRPGLAANRRVCIIAAAGGPTRVVGDALDESPLLQGWCDTGIYVTAVDRTSTRLYRIDPRSGAHACASPPGHEGQARGDYSFAADGRQAALIATSDRRYAEAAVLDLATRELRCLTDFHSRVRDWRTGRYETIEWQSTDGTTINGVLALPDDFDPGAPGKPRPLLVVLHGGPPSVTLPTLLSRSDRRNYPITAWLRRGAIVLMPNYRGSIGFGEAFRKLNIGNLGFGDHADVISGVDHLVARGWADPQRLGVMGWSQGGYITAFCATYDHRFRAASMGAGISNWLSYYLNTDIDFFTRDYLGDTPWAMPEKYRLASPMHYIQQARTPTLIQHGELDRRVPITNAYELHRGLKDMNVPTRLVVYRGMGHGITLPGLSRHVMEENARWFGQWVWGGGNDE